MMDLNSASRMMSLRLLVVYATLGLASCGSGGGSGGSSNVVDGGEASANRPPNISGSPPTSVTVDEEYTFTPMASDPDGDQLSFVIESKPVWAVFDSATGRLSGVPRTANVGAYEGIVITVSDGDDTAALPAFTITVEPQADTNSAPTISGTPQSVVTVGTQYEFRPSASDPDGDGLTFSIEGQPAWTTFDDTDGALSGTPENGDLGLYENIVITVSDGELTSSLPAFSIEVEAVSTGSVTLSWTPPTENTDGTPLTDLAGFKVYFGLSEGEYTNQITLDNPGLTSYVVENLAPNTYYFVATAFNADGVESDFSNVAVKSVVAD